MNEAKILKKLLELATERDKLIRFVESQEINILDHVIKIMVMVESNSKNHWAKEIHNFCKPITTKQKSNNRYPNKYFYMEHLYQGHLETYEEYENYVSNCLRAWTEEGDDYYLENKKEVRDEDHYKKVKNFYEVICQLMSKGQVPTKKEILDLL